MSSSNPRRTPKPSSSTLTPPPSLLSASGRPDINVNTNMSLRLRKSATFHVPNSPDLDLDLDLDLDTPSIRGPPRRCQSTLDDVVDAHKRRVALDLADIQSALAAITLEDHSPTTTRRSFLANSDPLPRSFLDHTVGMPCTRSYGPFMDGVMAKKTSSAGRRSLRPRHNRCPSPSRCSDSALGSSIGSPSGKNTAETSPAIVTEEAHHKAKVAAKVAAKAISRSVVAHTTEEGLPRLSSRANNRIQEHVLKPLAAKRSLREFLPILKDCPKQIHVKKIVCLRDLEQTLIFMAKNKAKDAAMYLDFCFTSIRCIQATVDLLSEREQTRPTDRPYTNGYFLDLVEQIHYYAEQVQAAKEKKEKGEKLSEMDPEPTDEVRLHGGLAKNGRPAELVRVKKNGKAISVATGLPVDLEDEDTKESMRFKRSLSQEADHNEAIMRSMARRKRSASAAELAPKRCCEPGCDKEFKRPCDLTKHEKTHSRPWKCPVESCKYHEYGWPTEKEMDRHHNDKHSAAPPLYECHYKPCPYRSKRESNCKQHMEKAHGWEYKRSKNNGKNREGKSVTNTVNGLATPQTTHIQTPSSDGHSIATPEDHEYNMGAFGNVMEHTTNHQLDQLSFPPYNPSELDSLFTNQPQLGYSPISDVHQSGSSNGQSPFSANPNPDQHQFPNFTNNNNLHYSLFENEDLYGARVQLPPSHDVFEREFASFEKPYIPYVAEPVPHMSPNGHGEIMLYTPTSLCEVDEGFEDVPMNNCNSQIGNSNDFQLFPYNDGLVNHSPSGGLFGEIPTDLGFHGQSLLDFYAPATAAATRYGHQHHQQHYQDVMQTDWSSSEY